MISDKLFEKIEHLENQSERWIKEANAEAEKIKNDTLQAIEQIKLEADQEIQHFISNKQEEIEKEKKDLAEKYNKMFDEVSKMILARRDQHLPEIIESFKKEFKQA